MLRNIIYGTQEVVDTSRKIFSNLPSQFSSIPGFPIRHI